MDDPSHTADLLRLDRILRGASGFKLIFLEFGDSNYRQVVMTRLQAMGHACLSLLLEKSWQTLPPLLEALGQLPATVPVHLLGMEHWLRGHPNYFQLLNYGRESLAAASCRPLLVWLDRESLRHMATQAPDLWAWNSSVISFIRPLSIPDDVLNLWDQLPMLEAYKDQHPRMEEISTFLQQNPAITQGSVYLKMELAFLHAAENSLDIAQQLAMEVIGESDKIGDTKIKSEAESLFNLIDIENNSLYGLISIDCIKNIEPVEKIAISSDNHIIITTLINMLITITQTSDRLYYEITQKIAQLYIELKYIDLLSLLTCRLTHLLENNDDTTKLLTFLKDIQNNPTFPISDNNTSIYTTTEISRLLFKQGNTDEAIRLFKEEVIPYYQQSENFEALTVAQKILHFFTTQSASVLAEIPPPESV